MKSLDNFEVYQKAVRLLGLITELIEDLPSGYATLIDQLRRSSLSIVLNIAEGAGKSTPKDKRKFFSIARGSALETYAVFDSCVAMKLTKHGRVKAEKQVAREIVAMLTSLTNYSKTGRS